jgi:hypothetical protein
MIARLTAMICLFAVPAMAADWWTYANPRFGYAIELPSEFHMAAEPDNGDGITLASTDRSAQLAVFGSNIVEGDFSTQAKTRLGFIKDDGWRISYSKTTSRSFSYSGTREDRIIYVRGVALCNGAVALFQIDYPKPAMQRYDAIVMRLVRSLHATEKCAASTQPVRNFPVTG